MSIDKVQISVHSLLPPISPTLSMKTNRVKLTGLKFS